MDERVLNESAPFGNRVNGCRVIHTCGYQSEEAVSAMQQRRRDSGCHLPPVRIGAARGRGTPSRRPIWGRVLPRPRFGRGLRSAYVRLRARLGPRVPRPSDFRGRAREFQGPLWSKASVPGDQSKATDAPADEEASRGAGPGRKPSFSPDNPDPGRRGVGRPTSSRWDHRANGFPRQDHRKRPFKSTRPRTHRTRRHVHDAAGPRTDARRDLVPRPRVPFGPTDQRSRASPTPPLALDRGRHGARDERPIDW